MQVRDHGGTELRLERKTGRQQIPEVFRTTCLELLEE